VTWMAPQYAARCLGVRWFYPAWFVDEIEVTVPMSSDDAVVPSYMSERLATAQKLFQSFGFKISYLLRSHADEAGAIYRRHLTFEQAILYATRQKMQCVTDLELQPTLLRGREGGGTSAASDSLRVASEPTGVETGVETGVDDLNRSCSPRSAALSLSGTSTPPLPMLVPAQGFSATAEKGFSAPISVGSSHASSSSSNICLTPPEADKLAAQPTASASAELEMVLEALEGTQCLVCSSPVDLFAATHACKCVSGPTLKPSMSHLQ